jgi:hypothetical protein
MTGMAHLHRPLHELLLSAQRGVRAWALRPSGAEQACLRLAATQPGPHRDAALVLWAAGALRSRYHGGPWTWDLLREGLPDALFDGISERVGQGFLILRRPVLHGQNGQQLRLSTLVAEAGLPGAVLGRPHGPVHEWCRGVLRDLQAYGVDGSQQGHEQLAGELAARRAPGHAAWLRDPGVGRLVGLLCLEVMRLHDVQPEALPAGTEAEVVAWLDVRDGAWRQHLPIDLGDADAVAMVRALLGDAAELARTPAAPVLRTTLWGPGAGHEFGLERRLRLTRTLEPEALKALFGLDDGRHVPPRLTLAFDPGSRIARLHRASNGPWCVTEFDEPGADGEGRVRVCLMGLPEGPRWAVGLAGAEALPDDQPWVFAPPPTGEGWILVGVGPTRRREPSLRVVLPPGAELHGGWQRDLGVLAGRRVVEVAGGGQVRLSGGGQIDLSSGDPDADMEVGALTVRGPRHQWSPPEVDVLRASPAELRVRWVTDEGAVRTPPANQIAHRSSLGGAWIPGLPPRSGRWRLRWTRDGRNDETGLLFIVPGDGVDLREVGALGGVLAPLGQPPPLVAVAGGQAGFNHLNEQGALRLTLAGGGPAPARLRVSLTFLAPAGQGRAGDVPLQLPFPVRRAGMLDRRGRWTAGPLLLDMLAGCRAEVVDPVATTGALLELSVPNQHLEVVRRIPGAHGVWGLDLAAVRLAVSRLLALQVAPDPTVILRLSTVPAWAPQVPAVQVQRYTRRLRGERGDLHIEAPMPEEDAARVTIQAHRLDAVSEPRTLSRLHPGQRWADLPPDEPGWWLMVARNSAGEVARPHLHRPPEARGEPEAAPTPLGVAVTLPTVDERRPAIIDRLKHLGTRPTRALTEPERADLELVQHHLRMLSVTAGSSLDVVRGLADAPHLAARLVTEAACVPAEFHRLWEALEELPFLWALVPHAAWRAAWTDIQDRWSILGNVGIGLQAEALGALCHALPALTALRGRWSNEPPQPVATLQVLARLRQVELLQRQADAEWPAVPPNLPLAALLGLDKVPVHLGPHHPAHRWPVLRAPWATAACAHLGRALNPHQIDELRRLRDFDPEWFDEGLFIATAQLAYGLPEVNL